MKNYQDHIFAHEPLQIQYSKEPATAQSDNAHQAPAGLTSRQSSVLRMQQTSGNQAVRRMLASNTVQRDDDESWVDSASNAVSGAYDAASDYASSAYNTVSDAASGAYDTAAGYANDAYNTVANGVSNFDPSSAGGPMMPDMGGITPSFGDYDPSSAGGPMMPSFGDFGGMTPDLSGLDPSAAVNASGSSAGSGGYMDRFGKWLGLDTDHGVMDGIASVPGSRLANMFWDVAGLTPIGGAVSTAVDFGEATFREGQALYNDVTGDPEMAKKRHEQAVGDFEGGLVDATGMIPFYGTGAGLMSLAYDATTDDPRDSAANQQVELVKAAWEQGNPFDPDPEWKAKDDARRMNQSGVDDMPGIPKGAHYDKVYNENGHTKIILTVNGEQQTYVYDSTYEKYVRVDKM